MPSAPVSPPESVIQQPQVGWQTAPGVHTSEPVVAPEPESYIPVQQEQWQQPYQPPQPAYEPQHNPHYEQPVTQPYQEYVPEPVEPVQPYVAPQPEPEPEPEIVEEVKPARPPLYYFEEVEERRAREREQLAAWYQPVPEPVQEPVTKAAAVSAPPVDPTPSVAPVAESVKQATATVAVAAPVFSLATGGAASSGERGDWSSIASS